MVLSEFMMIITRGIFALCVLCFFAAFGTAAAQEKFVPLYMGVPFIPLKTDEFNETVSESTKDCARDPVLVSLKFTGPFEGLIQTVERINQSAEAPAQTRVTVTNEGLLDDSVEGVKYFLVLEQTDSGVWQIRSAGKLIKCKEGRGQSDYSNKSCS